MYFGRILAGFIGLITLLIIILVIFGHGGKKPTTANPVKSLPDYSDTDATVSFTVDGTVNGDEMHRAIRVTVSDSQREVDVLQGYNPQVIQTNTYQNNQEAYSVFLKSINGYGFLAKSKSTKISDNEAGYCPLGYRYILDLNQDGADLSRTWTSSCGKAVGTSLANYPTIQQLFQDQIPDYDTLVGQVNLSSTSDK